MHEIALLPKKDRGEIVTLEPVKVIQILNPFRPATERKETALECVPGEYVWQTIERAGIKVREHCAVTQNGWLLPTDELSTARTRPGDWITIALGVGGGVWAFIGSLALALGMGVAMFLDPLLVPVLGPLLPYVVGSMVVQGAGLLVSALAGAFNTGAVSALNPTQTYNPAGPQTTARPGGAVPKAYGTFGWGGNIISSYVSFDGTLNEYINILVGFGLGQASAIKNLLINDKPVFGYRDLSYQTRLGTNDQTPMYGFNQTIAGYPQEIEMLEASGPIIVPGTGTLTQTLQVSVKFPGGLVRYDNNGNQKEVSYAYKLEYAVDNGTGTFNWQAVVAPRDTEPITTVDGNGFIHYPYWIAIPTDRYANEGIVYDFDSNVGNHRVGDAYSADPSVKVYNIDNSNSTYPVREVGEWVPYDSTHAIFYTQVKDWWGGWRIVSQMTTTPFYDNVSIYGLSPNKYAVRVTFWGAGPHDHSIPQGDVTDAHYTAQGWLWNINEVEYNDFSYPNMILVGIRALATSQLSGQNMQVMATITHDIGEDTTLPPELSGYEHDNPAIVAWDILNNPMYGMAMPWSQIDIPAFVTWANFCDERVTNSFGTTQRRFVFSGVFDQMSNAWACLQQVGQMSRAMIVRVGAMYSVTLDAPSAPVQIFTVGNIKADSLQETWIGLDDRCNLIQVTFADGERNYRSDLPVSVIGASEVLSGLPPKTTRVSLLGCTNRDQAWQWAYFQLLSTQTLLRAITIKCPIEAVTCQIGSVIGVQHDVPQWGWGGRIQPGSTSTVVNIDRDDLPPFTAGAGWTLSVQHPNVARGTATVVGTSTDSNGETFITLNAVPAGRLLLMVSASGATQAKVFSATGNVVQISTLGDIATGETVTLYDQNVIDIALVESVVGLAVTLTAPLSQAPIADSPWCYGQSMGFQPATLFRVTDLKQSSDFEITIKGLEYNTLIYEDAVPNYGEVVSTPTVNASVSNLTLSENFQTSDPNNPGASLISVGWQNGPNTAGALIYMRPTNLYYPTLPNGGWRLMGNVKGAKFSFWAAQNTEIEVQVVGFDNLNNPAPQSTAPTATMLVLGPGGLPPAVTTFALVTTAVPATTQTAPGPKFTWKSVDGKSGYEIRFVQDDFNGLGSDWVNGKVMADIAPASAAGVAMSWTAPQNLYGTYLISSFLKPPTSVNGAPSTFRSSAFSQPQLVVYGTVQDWQPIQFTGIPLNNPVAKMPFSLGGLADATVTAQTTATNAVTAVLLQNPNFAAGDVGWNLTGPWGIVAGAGYAGSGYLAKATGPTTGTCSNLQRIYCGGGTVLAASCFATSTAGATGTAHVRIVWFDGSGVQVGNSYGNAAREGFGWQQSRVAATAPAGTACAEIAFEVLPPVAGTWYFGGFTTTIQPNSLDEVPDGPTYGKPVGVVNGQTTTATYTANSVSSSIVESVNSYVNIANSATVAAINAMPVNGGYVLLTVCGAIASTNAAAIGWSLVFYRNGIKLSPEFDYQGFSTPGGGGNFEPFSFTILDNAPGAGPNTYTVVVTTNNTGTASLIPVNLMAVNFKA